MQYTFVENKEYQNGTQSSLCDDDNGDDIHSDGSRSVDNNPCINDDIFIRTAMSLVGVLSSKMMIIVSRRVVAVILSGLGLE